MRWRLELGRASLVDEEGTVFYCLTLSDNGQLWKLKGTPLAWPQRALRQAMEDCEGDYWDLLTSRHPPATALMQ